jgi:mono/diheme cytochrome c family protein
MKRFVMLVASVAALSMVPVAAQQSGQKPAPAAKPAASGTTERTGAAIFREYCAPCHGVNARGNGPAAPAFKQRPPDLTHLATRHKGFPRAQVEAMILGDDPLQPAHGSREMPVWGPTFRNSPDAATLMKNLIRHLESIQEK